MAVEGLGVQRPSFAADRLDAVGHHVVVMGEGIEGPAGEMAKRRRRPSLHRDDLASHPGGASLLPPGQGEVVAGLDGIEHRGAYVIGPEEGQHAEGLLGGQREVEADPHRRRGAPSHERRQVRALHQPATSRPAPGHDVRSAQRPALDTGAADLVPVLLPAPGQGAEVSGADPGEAGGLGDREQLVRRTGRVDVLRGGALGSSLLHPGQLGLADPAGPVGLDQGDDVGARRLRGPGGCSGQRSEQGSHRHAGARVQQPVELVVLDAERRGGVALVVEHLAVVGPAGSGAHAKAGPASGGATGGEQPGPGGRVPPGQHPGEVPGVDVASQAANSSAASEPASPFLAAVGVVAGRPGERL